jgi:hypothetical protein
MTYQTLLEVEREMQLDVIRQAPEFSVFREISVKLPEKAFEFPAISGFYLRMQLESAWFERQGVPFALAELAAARTAAQFIQSEAEALSPGDRAALPAWVQIMAGEIAPPIGFLSAHFSATLEQRARFRAIWPLLGTAESLMETGGDIRLARDPRSALNGYGCSHRPRPWAVTFASSTASSSSERGYEAADAARLRATLALLQGADRRVTVAAVLEDVRQGISRQLGLPPEDKIILAASGTDTELLALALTHLAGAEAPILNILIAPEETGRGVPMAARGLHFAVDTALGHDVTFEAPIAGFRPDTKLASIALRRPGGALRAILDVEADIAATVAGAIGEGRRVILHALDLSKTGLLAPRPEFLAQLRRQHGGLFDIVVDACQTRLSPASLRAYLALDAVVLITGSKFFTGPPFAGAAILPGSIAKRLGHARLPEGLDAYFGLDDFFPGCFAAANLPPAGNYGLALRWHAALAEISAVLAIPAARRTEILQGFGDTVRAAIATHPALELLEAAPIARGPDDEAWERLPSIFTFSLRAPHQLNRCLTPVEARAVYFWLNTDLSWLLPGHAAIAARICHIGQPVPLPQPGGEGQQGALRVSAGARLISGEPSHAELDADARLAREFADLTLVFEKISLLLKHWSLLWAASPSPRYRPARAARIQLENWSPVI